MRVSRHIVGILASTVLVAVFQYVAVVWSVADFHPGGDVMVPANLRKTAGLGNAISRPFLAPVLWIASKTGGYSSGLFIVQWLVLPVAYGAAVYSPFGYLMRNKNQPNKPVQRTGASARR